MDILVIYIYKLNSAYFLIRICWIFDSRACRKSGFGICNKSDVLSIHLHQLSCVRLIEFV